MPRRHLNDHRRWYRDFGGTMSKIILEEQVEPDTPSTNKIVIYPKAGSLYAKNDEGDETLLNNQPGTGDVMGPASATANAIARYSGTGGKTVKDSGVTIDDSDNVVIPGDLTVNGTQTIINTTDLDVTDKNITVNDGGNDASSEGAGLTVERTGTDGSFIYVDAAASKWKGGTKGAEIEFANVSSTQVFTNKDYSGIQLKLTTGATVTIILDEDDMVSNSDTALCTQQSIKAYADSILPAQSDAANNTIYGVSAGVAIDGTALNNTMIGKEAGNSVTTGDDNVMIGYKAGDNTTTSVQCVAIGSMAMSAGTTTAVNTTAMGYKAGRRITNGSSNTVVGWNAGGNLTGGANNVVMGKGALLNSTSVSKITAVGTGAAEVLTSGDESVYLGYKSGLITISTTDSTNMTLLGSSTHQKTTGTFNNAIAIGQNATVSASNRWCVGTIGTIQEIHEGSNAAAGVSTLVAGTVTVSNTSVTANSRIRHYRQAAGGTLGHISIGTITAGTSFVINSSDSADTSDIYWEIVEPA